MRRRGKVTRRAKGVSKVNTLGAAAPLPKSKPEYRIQDGEHCILKYSHKTSEECLEVLSNFTARVSEVEVRSNGIVGEDERFYAIDGTLANGQGLPRIHRLPTATFNEMNWVASRWGPHASIVGSKEALRRAIDEVSAGAAVRTTHTHTGWKLIDDDWIYLVPGGAISTNGFRSDVAVDLGPNRGRYGLPETARKPTVEGMRASLRLLDIADSSISVPLFSMMFRSVLAEVLPLDSSIYLEGRTGSGKSTLAALFLNHFGNFDYKSLPGSWASTPNQLENLLFTLKDMPVVVDDYSGQSRELQSKAERILRSVGNLSTRGRLSSNLNERAGRPPRGGLIVSGEVRPSGESLLARTLIVQVRKEQINWDLLTEAQKDAEGLPYAMAGFIAWLAPQIDALKASLPVRFAELRARASREGQHLRIPEVLANQFIGFEIAMSYSVSIGAMSKSEASRKGELAWATLVNLGKVQGTSLESHRPTRKFLEALVALVRQGSLTLLSMSENRTAFPKGNVVGLYDFKYLYLYHEVAFEAVAKHFRDSGDPFQGNLASLLRDFRDEGLSECDAGHLTAKIAVPSSASGVSDRPRLLKLRSGPCMELIGEETDCLDEFIEGPPGMREPGEDEGLIQ